MPWPPPTHIVSRPNWTSRTRMAFSKRGHDPRAGAAERVAECDGPAMNIEPFHVQAKITSRGDHLDRERLVDLNEVHVVDRHTGAGQRPATGLHRSEPHDLGTQGTDSRRDDTS